MQQQIALEALFTTFILLGGVVSLFAIATSLSYLPLGRIGAWLKLHKINAIFTLGFVAMTFGFFGAWWPLGLIVPGLLICGVMIWWRARLARMEEAPHEEIGSEDTDA